MLAESKGFSIHLLVEGYRICVRQSIYNKLRNLQYHAAWHLYFEHSKMIHHDIMPLSVKSILYVNTNSRFPAQQDIMINHANIIYISSHSMYMYSLLLFFQYPDYRLEVPKVRSGCMKRSGCI